MDLSIIVPLYNEEESVEPLLQAIHGAIDPVGLQYEILFIDDGSRDRTFEKAAKLAETDQRLTVIKFRRNYGQTPAMVAGIEHANGDVLVTMDGDLQNDPADIPQFIQRINAGYDIVVGWRYKRQDTLITRKIPSRIANWLIGKVTGVPIKDNGCSLKAYRASIVKNIPLYSEMHRFIPAMASLAGTKIAEIKVNHHARKFGKSKYGLSRIYKVLIDMLTIKTILSFASKPLVAFALASGVAAVISLAFVVALIAELIFRPEPISIVLPTLVFLYAALAIFLFLWGILAELAYRTGNLKLESFAKLKLVSLQPQSGDDTARTI